MKVKILFFPLAIAITLMVAIFYIQPEIQSAMGARASVMEKETRLSDIEQKVRNVGLLGSDIDGNKESENLVLKYLPVVQDDDRVVDALNFLSAQSGLSLSSVKMEKVAETAVKTEAAETTSKNALFATGDGAAAVKPAAIVAMPKTVKVTAEMTGSYESIRDVVGKISKMDRFQNFAIVKVGRAASVAGSQGQEATPTDTLKASLEIHFLYLSKVRTTGNLDLPIFSQSKIDLKAAQSLRQYVSSPVPSMEMGAIGKGNPFSR